VEDISLAVPWLDKYPQLFTSTLCGSRKYPYPTHGRDFSYEPPSPLDFPKTAHKLSPPPEIPIFSYTPWKYFYFLFKAKN